jgi:hypothetical protein
MVKEWREKGDLEGLVLTSPKVTSPVPEMV